MLLTEIATLDEVLSAHASELGRDFEGYRNHTYRVVNLCVALSPAAAAQPEKVAVAAAFHDLGIWTDGTFDYLEPSIQLAKAHLAHVGKTEWEPEVTQMIREHHKITTYRGGSSELVEPFRRADWVDVSRGLLRFGLSGKLVKQLYATWPSAGFHQRLGQLSLQRLRTHPWNPLPMMRF